MHISGLGLFYTMLYDDRCDIYRTYKNLNSDGSTSITYSKTPLYTDVPCRISFFREDKGRDSEIDRDPINFGPKLFMKPDVDIQAGDYVVVRRMTDTNTVGMEYKGTAALKSWFTTHLECVMEIDEEA